MKTKALLILMAALANQAISQTTFTNIVLPGNWPSTNFWWEASPPPISIVSSQAWAAVNENFRRTSNAFRVVNSGASLSGTNTWTGTNDFPAGKLTIGGVPVYAGVTNGGGGSGGGSNGPLVIAVSPSRIRSDESLTLKVTGSGFQSGGMYMSVGGYSQGGTYVSATEIDVDWTGGIYSDGSYDVQYTAANGSHTLIGGLTIGPSTAEFAGYATNAGSAESISLENKDVLFVSDRTIFFETNFYNMKGKAATPYFNTGLYLTNGFAGAEYELFGDGAVSVVCSEDGYTGWSRATTAVPVYIGVEVIFSSMSGSAFGPSNLVVYTWTQPGVFHRTNSAYSQYLFVDRPRYPDQVAPLRTVESRVAYAVANQTNWASIPAKSRVDLSTYGERLTGEWQRKRSATADADSIMWQWVGTNIWTLSGPGWESIDNDDYSFTLTGLTNFLVVLPAAYTSSVPVVLYTHTIVQDDWTPLPRSAVATNCTVQLRFSVPDVDCGFFKIVVDDGIPAFGHLNGVLSLPPRTIAATNSTTWGRGAGLLCVDTNYVYVSVGTNMWKRAAVTTW